MRAVHFARPGPSLAVALLGFFVVTLDALVVNVALPAIGRDLGGGITGLQWVVAGYTLMFAALLLWAGALSDRIGARRGFAAGLALFVAASAGCGLAPSLGALIVARFGQGTAAAVIMPASMALVSQAYPDRAKRARASLPGSARTESARSPSLAGGEGRFTAPEGLGVAEVTRLRGPDGRRRRLLAGGGDRGVRLPGGRGRTVRRSIALTPFGADFCERVLPPTTAEFAALQDPLQPPPSADQT